ncbi:MAG: hypothetical protein RIF37_06455 [Rhodospirillaceae bacterium]
MPFQPNDLTVLAYADGYTLWHYVTDDDATEIRNSGYFEDARDVFRNNDRIEVFGADESFDAVITTVGRVRLRVS